MKKWLNKLGKPLTTSLPREPPSTSYVLIDGKFSPLEAADVLLSLLNDKIKFHSVQLLNHGSPDSPEYQNSNNRILQLKESKQEITQLILEAKSKGQLLKINSSIEIVMENAAVNTSQTTQNPAE